jgi:predicted amidohydrolase YtcJ
MVPIDFASYPCVKRKKIMCQSHKHKISRRDFLKAGALGATAAALACRGSSQLIELTATPISVTTESSPVPILTPSEIADTILTPVEIADTIIINANIVTMDATGSQAQALAIKNGLISYIGTDDAVRKLTGESTQIIDVGKRTVTPGLIDGHCHLSACGLYGTVYVDINFPGISTITEMQAKVAEKIATIPPGEWVVGGGWVSYDGRYPNKYDIDPIAPNHPVMLINQGGHLAAVNSYALELASVNASTPDPPHGIFLREANGEPDGTLVNHPALDYFRRLWPPDLLGLEAMEASILGPQAKFASMGVTSFQDVYARGMPRMEAYFNIARRGQMTIRGQVMNTLEYIQELDGRIEDIRSMLYEDDFMRFGGAKFQVDGAALASLTHEPHNGIAWNLSIWDPNDLNQAVAAFHDAGYQVALHTIGDAAVDMALDAIEKAMNANPRSDPRHRLEHAVLNTDQALQRTKDLGVVVSTQPQFIRLLADKLEEIWGTERTQRIFPTRTWLEMGVPLSLSSDAPSLPWWDPQTTLFGTVARYSATNKPIGPEQALTVEEAMYAHTMGGAYIDFAENKKGSLEPGKFADLVVWTDSPYSVATRDIINLTVDLTMINGKIVYQA